jgi:hypothetical protein
MTYHRVWEFEDTKGVIRIRKSKQYRQHNGQERSKTDLQNITHNTKDRVTQSPLLVESTLWSFPYSWLTTGFVTRVTRRVPIVEHELLTLPEHMSSTLVVSGDCVTRSWLSYFSFMFCFMILFILFSFWIYLKYFPLDIKQQTINKYILRRVWRYQRSHQNSQIDLPPGLLLE